MIGSKEVLFMRMSFNQMCILSPRTLSSPRAETMAANRMMVLQIARASSALLLWSAWGTVCSILGIVQSTGDSRMSGQWFWWSKWDADFRETAMGILSLFVYPLTQEPGEHGGSNPQSPGKFPVLSVTPRSHSSWADLRACCWVTYRDLAAVTSSYVVSLFRKCLQQGLSSSEFTWPSVWSYKRADWVRSV